MSAQALIDAIDHYADTRHRCGVHLYNAETDAARRAVVAQLEALAKPAEPAPKADADVPTGNVWNNISEALPTLKAASRGEWTWAANTRCKYVQLRIDMRDGGCLIQDRHGVRITPATLARQVFGAPGLSWPQFAALLSPSRQPGDDKS